MNIAVKILLFAFSLTGLVISACLLSKFYYIPFLTDTVIGYQAQFPMLNTVFAWYLAFIALVFAALLLLAIFIPAITNSITLKKSKGTLVFSIQTVESVVRYSFSDVPGINTSRIYVRLKPNPDKTKVYVRLSLKDPSDLSELSEAVQNKIESAMKASLGINIQAINISVLELNDAENPVKAAAEAAPAEKRVI